LQEQLFFRQYALSMIYIEAAKRQVLDVSL